jgi:hypothetical protein
MSNMSYCRHENTLRDLQDVNANWDDFDPEQASYREIQARKEIRQLIIEMADNLAEEEN